MPRFLPLRANLEWLKKASRDRLEELRRSDPESQLSDAQLAVAREYGFRSWRAMKGHIEQVRSALDPLVPRGALDPAASTDVAPDDPDLVRFLAAIDAGDLTVVTDLLARRPVLAAARGLDGQTPLHAAARRNDPKIGVFLLVYGADPGATYGESAHDAHSWAVTCHSLDFAKTLIRLGAWPDLFCASGLGEVDHVREWFDPAGGVFAGASRAGSTRFADGSRLPCPPADPRDQVSDALYIASRNGHAGVVRVLLTHGPDLSFRAYLGATALHWAHFGGSRDVVRQLEAAGADPESRDDTYHLTPRLFGIAVPANWGFAFLVKERLRDDPSLALLTDGRTSPLHEAARGGHVDVIRLLLGAGAPKSLRNGDGLTALQLAEQNGHAAAVDLLRGT